MAFINAKVIYKNDEFVGCTTSTSINSALVRGTPQQAWISQNRTGFYELTFKDPHTPSTLVGTWITEGDQGMLIDGSVASVNSALSQCCGTDPITVTGPYAAGFPAIVGPTLTLYTFTRTDDGDIGAMEDFMLAYLQWVDPGSLQRTLYSGGVSTYTFNSYTDPTPQGNDSKTGETARVFQSNAPGALTSGYHYLLTGWINGELIGTPIAGAADAALSTIATAATSDASFGPLGTWSIVSSKVQLSTSTVDNVSLVVTQVAP